MAARIRLSRAGGAGCEGDDRNITRLDAHAAHLSDAVRGSNKPQRQQLRQQELQENKPSRCAEYFGSGDARSLAQSLDPHAGLGQHSGRKRRVRSLGPFISGEIVSFRHFFCALALQGHSGLTAGFEQSVRCELTVDPIFWSTEI